MNEIVQSNLMLQYFYYNTIAMIKWFIQSILDKMDILFLLYENSYYLYLMFLIRIIYLDLILKLDLVIIYSKLAMYISPFQNSVN